MSLNTHFLLVGRRHHATVLLQVRVLIVVILLLKLSRLTAIQSLIDSTDCIHSSLCCHEGRFYLFLFVLNIKETSIFIELLF